MKKFVKFDVLETTNFVEAHIDPNSVIAVVGFDNETVITLFNEQLSLKLTPSQVIDRLNDV